MYIHDCRTVVTLDAGGTFSRLGASKAISAGAYAFALSKIDGE